MIMDVKKILKSEEGQSIVETMLFLPIFVYFIVFLTKAGSAINTSINQQKSTRAYTYYLLKGNSNGFRQTDLGGNIQDFNLVSSFILGFRERSGSGGQTSFATCHSIPNLPWLEVSGQECDDGPGITDPEDPNTLPKRTAEKIVLLSPTFAD